MSVLSRLVGLDKMENWDLTCQWAEENIPELAAHLETWGRHCGAPRQVYRGHLVKMLINIEESNDR